MIKYFIYFYPANTVKRKWKALRDGYTKYKKLLRSAHGKSIKYSWSSHLSFLDCNADNQDDSLNSCMVVEDPSSISDTPEFIRTFTISPNMLEDIPEIIDDSNSDTEPAQGEYDNPSKKQKIEEQFEVLGPVQNADAMQNTNDSVDYLFLSYAQAFKNFSLKKQAILKVDIASLFSEAELCELSRKTDKT